MGGLQLAVYAQAPTTCYGLHQKLPRDEVTRFLTEEIAQKNDTVIRILLKSFRAAGSLTYLTKAVERATGIDEVAGLILFVCAFNISNRRKMIS